LKTPNIEVLAPNIEKYNSQYSPIYREVQEDKGGPSRWDKVRFYWEHVREHIQNLGKCLELITNWMRTQ